MKKEKPEFTCGVVCGDCSGFDDEVFWAPTGLHKWEKKEEKTISNIKEKQLI